MKLVFMILALFTILQLNITAQDSTSTNKPKNEKQQLHHSAGFVDKNNDGYNDNAPDHDGDGIPNGLDPDFIKSRRDRAGDKLPYVDRDGDGINDNLQFKRFRGRNMWMNNNEKNSPQSGQPSAGNKQNERRRNGGKK